VTRFVDPRTNDWLYTWNALDQLVRVQTPTNLTARCATDFFYDANDNLFTVSGTVRDRFDNPVLDQVNRFRYDPLHRLTRVEYAVDAAHSMTNDFVYDANDQCVLARGATRFPARTRTRRFRFNTTSAVCYSGKVPRQAAPIKARRNTITTRTAT